MRYPKIAQRFGEGALPGGAWVAEEKVHGAHLALVSDGRTVRAAGRRGPLDEERFAAFFGLARIWPVLATAAAAAARTAGREVVLYGELAGGGYPHPEVAVVEEVGAVQTGVWYAPDLVWLAFDGAVRTPSGLRWMSRAELAGLASGTGLECVPLVARGARHELRELPVDFPTLVPGALGLPELPGNRAEGYVLKPDRPWSAGERGPRPVLKVKHPDFAEDVRYNGSRPFVPPSGAVPAWLLTAAVERLTPPRAAAARSKLGPSADPSALAEELVADLLTDLADAVGGLPESDHRSLTAALTPAALTLSTPRSRA
ncbi:Rnl2 family RNA ligase [Actinocorallia herbida]|uniref:Rnl2 family RNA ligase n=1 Tax=Actinocorallia herbida TaxID=58109 RepID=A0A3N1D1A7_9ACTN|nr:RNA ligase family protein [Actinocorallia herbida]ROO87304.1 Rnl2 family RNA ligase [Actinocorallia herbida]